MAGLEESTRIVQLKVRLLGLSPMIWRRVLVPESVSLRELHGILQVDMGWDGIPLYYFDIHAVHYGSFELDAESPDTPPFPVPVSRQGSFCLPLRHGRLLGARGAHREIPGPEAEANLPRLHRWRRGLPARGLRRPSRVPGTARGGDGLGCVVRPGPGRRFCLRCPWRARAPGA